MRVPLSWLREYVDFDLSAEELADRLTNAGFEVSEIEYLGRGLEKVLTAEVVRLESHPDSDHLLVATVDAGSAGYLRLVTGAPNVATGQKVAVALPGAVLPNLGPVRKARLRGIWSEGVLCSAWELGMEGHTQEEGILVLPPATPVGEPVARHIGLDETVLEVDITPNRADCLGLVNLAREVAALTGSKVRLPEAEVVTAPEPVEPLISVEVEEPELCSRYVAALIRNVRIGPSPEWMQQRLRAAGMRPINNVVDVTNYVMLELGQPLHAFDYHKLRGRRIVVRRARPGERLVTLDGAERELTPDMLVIADAERPVALAGVMGGEDTEISGETTWVLLESANFSAASIRRTSRRLGLRSEASLRFERGVDPEVAPAAARRAARLMVEVAGGEVLKGLVDEHKASYHPVTISLRVSRVNALLGVEFSPEEVEKYLSRLGLECERDDTGQAVKVRVPSYRGDLRLEEDLVEEIARLYGYERIPAVFPPLITAEPKLPPKQKFLFRCRHLLADFGFQEVITYSFISPRAFEILRVPADHPWRRVVLIANPLGEEQSVMRPTLFPGLIQAAATNASWRGGALRLFEVGKVFLPHNGQVLPREEWRLAVLAGGEEAKGWGWPSQELDFFYLKGVLAALLDAWGLEEEASFVPGPDLPALHPGRRARVVVKEAEVGWLGELCPEVREAYELVGRICLLELNLEKVWEEAAAVSREYRPWSRYPAVARDLAVVVPEAVSHAQVRESILRHGGPLLKEVSLFDLYRGGQVPEGCKSLAYRLVFQSDERTLTEGEVASLFEGIVRGLEKDLGARLRS